MQPATYSIDLLCAGFCRAHCDIVDRFILKLTQVYLRQDCSTNALSSISVFLWLEYHSRVHYVGCLGQQSY